MKLRCPRGEEVDDEDIRSEAVPEHIIVQAQALAEENEMLMRELKEMKEQMSQLLKDSQEKPKYDFSDCSLEGIWEVIDEGKAEVDDAITELKERMQRVGLSKRLKGQYEFAIKEMRKGEEEQDEKPKEEKRNEGKRREVEKPRGIFGSKEKGMESRKEREGSDSREMEDALEQFFATENKDGEYHKLYQMCLSGADKKLGKSEGRKVDMSLRMSCAVEAFAMAGHVRHGWTTTDAHHIRSWSLGSLSEYGATVFEAVMKEYVRTLDKGDGVLQFLHNGKAEAMMVRLMREEDRKRNVWTRPTGQPVQQQAAVANTSMAAQRPLVTQPEKPQERAPAMRCDYCNGFGHKADQCFTNPESPSYDPNSTAFPAPVIEYGKGRMDFCWTWTNGRPCTRVKEGTQECVFSWKHICGFQLPDGTMCREKHKAIDVRH